ncbi:tripartite tricarboxylate transporter TctB family protein [Paracoccus liaowanqingii]|uniref:Tripartite tricarboxylate transporter TctB family protein n=1 Tax=Paracoccus liaowanqingii TaxID=2560053 RepID=A0A4P7HMK9_9RHOB|nr:tripartite tricarboxylate transporter TctB family protein [Paracoccus liaowanqingii]QBX34913.1 tripartite tricarboxylate transporter TctB family protein [Paracoccus liaowanqingii]
MPGPISATTPDWHDLAWGAVLALTGLAVAGYAALHYEFGTLRRMGPGFFPVVLGLGLAGLGLLIAIPARNRPGQVRPFAWAQAVGVIGSLLVFGLLLDRIGLMASTVLCVAISSAVAPRGGFLWRAVLTVAVTALVWLLFVAGLNLSIPVWPWSR